LFEDRNLGSSIVATMTPKETSSVAATSPSLFDAVLPTPSESPKNILPEPTIVQSNLRRPKEPTVSTRPEELVAPSIPQRLEKSIERVIIFYTDGTFSESRPM
jgi:hypothetical protein